MTEWQLEVTELDDLPAGCRTPDDVAALHSQLLQRVIDRSLEAKLDAHPRHARPNGKAEQRARRRLSLILQVAHSGCGDEFDGMLSAFLLVCFARTQGARR